MPKTRILRLRFEEGDEGVGLKPEDTTEQLKTRFALVTIENFCIQRLFSQDGFASSPAHREGTLAFNLNSQETSLSWATNRKGKVKNIEQKLKDYVLFMGPHQGNIDCSVSIIETDDKMVSALQNAKTALLGASAVANFIPAAGTMVSAGFGLLAQIMDFIRGQVDNDLELAFYGSIGQLGADNGTPLRKGVYTIFRKSDAEFDQICDPRSEYDIDLRLRVNPFQPQETTASVILQLTGIKFEIPPRLDNWTLVMDATFGTGKAVSKFGFKQKIRNQEAAIEDVMGFQNKTLYRGNWSVGIPFSISAACVKAREELKAIEGIVSELGTQGKRFTEDKEEKEQIENATKAVQSLRALIVEFLPKKISIGTMSGLLIHRVMVEEASWGNGKPQSLIEVADLAPNTWTRLKPLKLSSEKGGTVTLHMRMKLDLSFAITTVELPQAEVGQDYNTAIETVGGTPPYSFCGDLPCGLKLSEGAIRGKPTTPGQFSFLVTAEDDSVPRQRASRTLTITICQSRDG